MARKAKIDTDTLIGLIDRYYIEKCDGDASQIKIPQIGEYIRSQGYDIADYLIRRNETVRDYISKLRDSSEERHVRTVAVYRDIDLDSFIGKNNTKEKLKASLIERERYYREITYSASYSFNENRRLTEQIKELKRRTKELEASLEKANDQVTVTLSKFKDTQAENGRLRMIIDTYVYPEIANELLKEQGLIKETAGIVNPENVKNEIITADTDISPIKNNVIKGLFTNI